MLIRRKVFSLLDSETGEERLFSSQEVDYDIDERMYSDDDSNVAKYAGIGAATGLAAIGGGKLAGKAIIKHQGGNFLSATKSGINKLSLGKLYKTSARNRKIAKTIQKPYDYLGKKAKEIKDDLTIGTKGAWYLGGKPTKTVMVAVPTAAVAAAGYSYGKNKNKK